MYCYEGYVKVKSSSIENYFYCKSCGDGCNSCDFRNCLSCKSRYVRVKDSD